MFLRSIHFVAGIMWIGLLYFFNLVSVPVMKELDPGTRGKVMPSLMLRALWWFRVSAVVTVLAGLIYWGSIVASDARNGGGTSGTAMLSFFLIWTVTWGVLYALLLPGRGCSTKDGCWRSYTQLSWHTQLDCFWSSIVMGGKAIACWPSALVAVLGG